MVKTNDQRRGQRHAAQTHASKASVMAASSTRRSVKRLLLLAFCLAVSLPTGVAFAQSVNGLISGTVLDPQGASVAGATVTLTDQLTTTRQTTQTEQNGAFVFPEIRPGTYNLAVEKTGFERFEKMGISLVTADRLSVGTLKLKVGSSKELVMVTDQKRVLDTNRPSCPVGVYDAIAWSQKSGLRCGLHDKSQGLHRRQYPQIFSNPPASIPS
jgi:Carboxypeptidase regulatory-like domain